VTLDARGVDRRGLDTGLLLAVGMLVALGIGMVYSASFVVAHNDFGDDTYFLVRHVIWIAIGLVSLAITSRLDYHLWQRFAVPLFCLSLALLVLVLIPGISTSNYGASRWFSLGTFLSLQPSEFAKLAIVIYLAAWISRVGGDIHGITFGTIPFVLIISIIAGLVLIEPDVGTTIVIVLTAASMFFLGGANVLHALLGAIIGCLFLLKFVTGGGGYKADRLEAFLDPWADPSGIGWHTTQTLVALGSGGFAGLGLGASRQKYYFLPNAHTDSIFAIVGEEIGFIGTMLVLALFLYVAWRGLSIAFSARDNFGRSLAAGATLLIAWQALLNMAVVSNVVPNTGVPLPFLSFGGSSMVVSMTAIGIVLSISRSVSGEQSSLRKLLLGAPTPELSGVSRVTAAAGNGALASAPRSAQPRRLRLSRSASRDGARARSPARAPAARRHTVLISGK